MSCYGFTHEHIARFVGHSITLNLTTHKTIQGYLYTIDPNTHTIVLYDAPENKMQVIMKHAVSELSIDEENRIDIDTLITPRVNQLCTKEWIKKRRVALIEFFKQNHIPMEEGANEKKKDTKNDNDHHENDHHLNESDGDDAAEPVIHVLGCARVESPYLATNVICDNPLIRKRVRDFILELPNI
ncbi:hypothetical protein BDF20DRAFT_916780 [Mycotypha africana]|uniref:uncharacterized protein n=1 Tax=Mycotypha africana TaxID=64632 RepID=UPI002300046C|nr:uncharacterized protein BDF20DRAFT_916780 [Mycotypha africana]KAI8968227.1 hypothetical protein BDF20DRAFT_916780 [Mycotypha africana]